MHSSLAHVVRSTQMHLTAVIFNWKEPYKYFNFYAKIQLQYTGVWNYEINFCFRTFHQLSKMSRKSENVRLEFKMANFWYCHSCLFFFPARKWKLLEKKFQTRKLWQFRFWRKDFFTRFLSMIFHIPVLKWHSNFLT